MKEGIIKLAEGGVLGYAEYGDPQGRPVFLFHGQPGNRLFHPGFEQIKRTGVRLIVPDRPGYGLSAFQESRKLMDWPGDVLAIADHLSIEKFSVIGFSGGGPYALACAHAIPERLERVLVVAGAPPMASTELRRQMLPLARVNYALTRHAKPLFRWVFRIYWRQARKNPSGFFQMIRKQALAADQIVLGNEVIFDMLRTTWEENLRVDSRGYVYDAELLMDRWGFSLEEIQMRVELWWGALDENVPIQVMEYLSRRLPNCEIRLVSDGGHFILLSHWEQIFQAEGVKNLP
jgi:pimeloyl-ACP methyl ester carboxylesterase